MILPNVQPRSLNLLVRASFWSYRTVEMRSQFAGPQNRPASAKILDRSGGLRLSPASWHAVRIFTTFCGEKADCYHQAPYTFTVSPHFVVRSEFRSAVPISFSVAHDMQFASRIFTTFLGIAPKLLDPVLILVHFFCSRLYWRPNRPN